MSASTTTQPLTLASVMQLLRAHRADLFARYPLHTMAVFGSVSRGDNGPESDVDIMVEFTQPVGMAFICLAMELEEILHCKVDLVTRKGVKDRYFKYIEPDLQYVF